MLTQTCKTNRVSTKMKVIYLALATLLLTVLFQLTSLSKASAATITPDGTTCTLDEAVGAMNNGADENGCVATGAAYGTDDTIDIPAGTFAYNDTNTAAVSLAINGAGMGQTIIDLNNSNGGFTLSNVGVGTAAISDLTIIDPSNTEEAVNSVNYSMTISRVEIYSTDSNSGGSGIIVDHRTNGLTSLIQDVYIHDIEFDEGASITIVANASANSSGNIIERATLNNIFSSTGLPVAISSFGSASTIEATIRNSTMTNIDSDAGFGGIVYMSAYADVTTAGGTGTSTLNAINNTFFANTEVTTATAMGLAAIAVAAPTQTATATINAQNNLVIGQYNSVQEMVGCNAAAVGAGGTETATFTSLGGNITDDDTTCNAYFTETNDQTDVSNLDSTLGTLQDNGGYTPTIALLTGSPAIDNGITNAVTTDQRGTSRPQGSAFDSGAYELAVSSPSEDDDSSESASLADTGENTALITLTSIILIATGAYSIRKLTT